MLHFNRYQWQLAGIALLALVVLAIALVSANTATATTETMAPAAAGGGNMTSQGMNVAATRPWTREEMLAAKPYPMPEVKGSGTASLSAPSGKPGFAPAGLPGGEALNPLSADELLPTSAPYAVAGYSYPAPYTGYEVFASYTSWPYETIGKLFFHQGTGNYVCSAASMGNYAIWTAGHCVHKGNNSSSGWSTNVVFVPAYRDGAAPFGQWSASWLATKTKWYNSANLQWDEGGAVLKLLSGKKISQKVGWLGFAWNWSYNQHWDLFGYPAEAPFNGKRMRECEASFAYSLSYGSGGSLTQGVGCNLNGGASGGPWILAFGTGNYINGENSYTRLTESGARYVEMNSPHFDNNAKSLFDVLNAGTP